MVTVEVLVVVGFVVDIGEFGTDGVVAIRTLL
jgi:hypothetical protein